MKLMKTQDAVGQVLCHDITQIIKGVTKVSGRIYASNSGKRGKD